MGASRRRLTIKGTPFRVLADGLVVPSSMKKVGKRKRSDLQEKFRKNMPVYALAKEDREDKEDKDIN